MINKKDDTPYIAEFQVLSVIFFSETAVTVSVTATLHYPYVTVSVSIC